MNPADSALLDLLEGLDSLRYSFVTVTPETHRRAIASRSAARDLRDIFGWNLKFRRSTLPDPLWGPLEASGMAVQDGMWWRSRVRVSSVAGRLFLHSAYPTLEADSVFLGPDSYRFVSFLRREIPALGPVRHVADIGAGAGVGAVAAADLLPGAKVTMSDVNPLAVRFARINARRAGIEAETVEGEGLSRVEGPVDLAIANPPFIVDPARRAYRHGGDMHGARLSLDWALEAAARIEPGGAIMLYSGSAIVGGRDPLREALEERLGALGCSLRYAEVDPDIFGELIGGPGYEDVERLAAIGAVIRKA